MSLTLRVTPARQHVRLCAARSAGQPPLCTCKTVEDGQLPSLVIFRLCLTAMQEGSTQPGSVAICVATPVTENLAGEAAKARWLWLRGQGRPSSYTWTEGSVRKWRLGGEQGGTRGHAVSVLLGVETVGGLSIGGDGRRAVGSCSRALAPS